MIGPEHYTEAERLLENAVKVMDTISAGLGISIKTATEVTAAFAVVEHNVATAQAHATLALTAATNQLHPDGPWQVSS